MRFLLTFALSLALVNGYPEDGMDLSVSTHLMFQGAAHDAIELYQSVFPEFEVQRQELHEDGEQKGRVQTAYVKFGDHELIIFDSPPVMTQSKNRVHEVFPYLRVKGAEAAIRFYTEVFGATEKFRLTEPGGRIGHVELDLGNIVLMLSDEFPEYNCLAP